MSLSQFLKLPSFRRPIVDKAGHLLNEYVEFLDTLVRLVNANSTLSNTEIGQAAIYLNDDVPTFVWNNDADDGSWPADDTQDLTAKWLERDSGVTEVANRVLRGSFTQSSATIAVTAVSNSETMTGVSTAYVLTGDGTKSVRATITLTFADGTKRITVRSWSAQDLNTAGGTPAGGGGK